MPDSSIQPQASKEPTGGSGEPITTQNITIAKSNEKPMRNTLSVRLPNRLLPNSLNRAVAVHEKATPIDISSPMYVIIVVF